MSPCLCPVTVGIESFLLTSDPESRIKWIFKMDGRTLDFGHLTNVLPFYGNYSLNAEIEMRLRLEYTAQKSQVKQNLNSFFLT